MTYYIYIPKDVVCVFGYYMNSVYEVLCSNNIETVITSDYNNTIIKSTSDVLLIWMVWCNEEFLKTTKFENIIFFNSDPLSREKLRCMYKNVFCHPKIKLWIDYQHSNIKYLESIGRDPKTTHLIPFIWHPISTNTSSFLNNTFSVKTGVFKDIDILFYGSPNERRTAVIENLKENTNLNIQWKSGLENDDLYYNILRSKIVLVVFFYPNNRCIDFYRIAPIVYLKTHIVHENISEFEHKSWVESGQEDIFKYITFCKYDNIVDKCCELLLKGPEKLTELGELCYEHKKENYSLSKMLLTNLLKYS